MLIRLLLITMLVSLQGCSSTTPSGPRHARVQPPAGPTSPRLPDLAEQHYLDQEVRDLLTPLLYEGTGRLDLFASSERRPEGLFHTSTRLPCVLTRQDNLTGDSSTTRYTLSFDDSGHFQTMTREQGNKNAAKDVVAHAEYDEYGRLARLWRIQPDDLSTLYYEPVHELSTGTFIQHTTGAPAGHDVRFEYSALGDLVTRTSLAREGDEPSTTYLEINAERVSFLDEERSEIGHWTFRDGLRISDPRPEPTDQAGGLEHQEDTHLEFWRTGRRITTYAIDAYGRTVRFISATYVGRGTTNVEGELTYDEDTGQPLRIALEAGYGGPPYGSSAIWSHDYGCHL